MSETAQTTDVLDNPVWHALRGAHRGFALAGVDTPTPRAARYRPDVTSFAAVDDVHDPHAWAQLAHLMPPGDRAAVIAPADAVPPGWQTPMVLRAVQMMDDGSAPDVRPTPSIVELTTDDVPAMLELADLTKPGPFGAATIELGGYVGVRDGTRLVAMTGHRLRPPGWIEISAVCTHPDHRGRGLARALVTASRAAIRRAGAAAFLHVLQDNTSAIGLYESMGFARRADLTIVVVTR